MNAPQKFVLIVGFLLVLSMALFPPWTFVFDKPESSFRGGDVASSHGTEHVERPAGYHLVFGQHVPQDETRLNALFGREVEIQYISTRIDTSRLTIQIIAVLLLVGILYLVLYAARRPA